MTSNILPVGHKLTSAREALMLSVADVVAILKIKEPIISMLEQDSYPEQMIDIFTKGQLVAYCKLLKLDSQVILNSLEAKGYDFKKDTREPIKTTHTKTPSKHLKPIAFLGILLTAYLFLQPSQEKKATTFTQPIIQSKHYEH
mgnify:CR=1 FL=1|tara:strand:- start:321 stop:749 length:429 start_codon:yes stop_codon:yes gene_type:complete